MNKSTTMRVRRIFIRTFPVLDCIDAGIDMIDDPSLRRAKRLVSSVRKAMVANRA